MKRREAGIEAYLDFLQSLRECGDTDNLIPWSKLETCGLETLAAYARTQKDHPTL